MEVEMSAGRGDEDGKILYMAKANVNCAQTEADGSQFFSFFVFW